MKKAESQIWNNLINTNYWETAGKILNMIFTENEIIGKLILDAGCAAGIFSLQFLYKGAGKVIGFDINSSCIDAANNNLHNSKIPALDKKKIEFINKNINDFDYPDEYFDIIFANGIIYYCKSYEGIFKKFYSLLKPGGIIFISFSKKNFILILLNYLRMILSFFIGKYWQKLLPVLSFAIFPILRLFGFTETREIITKRLSSQIVPVIKLYTLPEAQNILAANNFKIIKLFGSVAAQGWSSDFGIKAQKIIKKTNSN